MGMQLWSLSSMRWNWLIKEHCHSVPMFWLFCQGCLCLLQHIYIYIYSFKWICQVLYRVFWLIYSWFKIGHYIQETDSRRSDEIAVEDGSGAQVSVINEVRVTDSGALPFGVDILASCFKAACVCCTIYIVYLCMAEQTQKIENVQIFK